MISSGTKRGLAAVAVSALAVTGVPGIANAVTLADQETTGGISLRTTAGGVLSIASDGTNNTISLVATADSSYTDGTAQAVEYVTFFYGTDDNNLTNDTKIATVQASATGEFKHEWTPPVGVSSTDVIAAVTDANGALLTANAPTAADAVTISGTAATVEIAANDGELGYFPQPNTGAGDGNAYSTGNNVAGIKGTSSTNSLSVLATAAGDSLGVSGGTIAAGSATNGIYNWTGTVNVAAAAIDNDANIADQILPVVETGAGTRDAQGFSVYAQQIKGISGSSTAADPDSGEGDVSIKVVDQNGKPVAGANVVSVNPAATATTNANGVATFANVASGSHNYYVNTTDDSVFNTGIDYQTSVTVAAARPEAISFVTRDGAAFDVDEYDPAQGDLTFMVNDGAGNGLNGQRIFYKVSIDPFKAGADTVTSNEQQLVTASGGGFDGVAPLVLSGVNSISDLENFFSSADQAKLNAADWDSEGSAVTVTAYVNRDGSNPGQDAGDLALTPVTFKTGEANAAWDADGTSTVQVGTTQTLGGTLTLGDGTVLAGRTLDVTYSNGGGDSALATTQPEGTTRLSATSARVVTDADGKYSVAVTDPTASGTATTETGTLTVKGTATVGSGSSTKNGVGVDATDTLTLDWSLNATAFKIAGGANVNLMTNATPGRPVSISLTVTNAQNQPLKGQAVTLKTDHGFFTPYAASEAALTPAAAPTEGGLYGVWKNLGDTITVTTNASGVATATVAIEKDAGFDDNGAVTSLVTATAGNVTSNDPNSTPISVAWSSSDPLNGTALDLAQSAKQSVSVLPKAPTREGVNYDVQAEDQFGNLVIGGTVNLSSDLAASSFETTAGAPTTTASTGAADNTPETVLVSEAAGDATPTGSWTTKKTTYTDGDLATPGLQPVKSAVNAVVTDDGETVNFYETDYATSTYSLVHTGADTQPTGTTVTMTYKAVDQEGEPITGYYVTFYRTGPDDLQDGDGNSGGYTNANGEVTYVFQGAKAGKATVTAVLEDDNGQLVPQGQTTDSVQFQAPAKASIHLKLTGKNNGKKADKLKANADANAAGLKAVLYRGSKKVATGTLNAEGDFTFKVKDQNGKKATKYTVKVAATDLTKSGKASKKVK